MKKIFKKVIILIFIFLMLLSLLSNKEIYAADANDDQKECGRILSAFAINFFDNYGEQTLWNVENREITYTGKTVDGLYQFDCVGWVSFAVHQSLKLGDETFTYFAVPPGGGNQNPGFTNGFELIKGSSTQNNVEITTEDIIPGDILFLRGSNHVLIYVGKENGIDKVIHSTSATGINKLTKTDLDAWAPYCGVGRITAEAAAAVIKSGSASELFNGQGGVSKNDIDGGFEYRGLQPGKLGIRRYDFEWVVLNLKQILNWYIGISTYITRAIYVGLVECVEFLIDNTMEAVTGTEASLTIEKLLFNEVPILDVNFFNFESAGGQVITSEEGEPGYVLYAIRENIAIWYNVMRNLSIILLLITLLYIGIRIAISTAAEQKARYKELLKSWFTSFIIVFSIHYVMIIILQLNQTFLDNIRNTSIALRWRRIVIRFCEKWSLCNSSNRRMEFINILRNISIYVSKIFMDIY